MTCFTILLHHYRVYTCVIVIFILAFQLPVNAVSEYKCPNKITDIIGVKCYSLHTEWPKFWYKYTDAVEYCKQNGGTLLSKTTEQEIDFLRELYTKINSWSYWVSGYRYNEEWKYLGDNASIPMRLIKQNSEPDNCLAIKLSKNEMIPMACDYNSYYICVYSGEECEQGLCYQISFTKENFSGAITKCKQVGYKGHLVEIRNDKETFTFLTTKEQEELRFPSIWKQRNSSLINNQCEIYTSSSLVEKYNCNEPFGFVCEYKATVTSNTMKPSSQVAAFIPNLDTSPTSSSYKQTTSLQMKLASSAIPLPQSTKSGLNMINVPVMPTSNAASTTSSQVIATVGNYNAPVWNNNRQTTKLISISIAVAVLILIGIIILIILLVRIMRKNEQRKNEIIYLEPIAPTANNTIPRRSLIRDLPDIPCDSKGRSSIFSECEALKKQDPEEPLQNAYTYID